MFKKILVAGLVLIGMFMFVPTASAEFSAMYDKAPECFMSLDYLNLKSDAPQIWAVAGSPTEVGRTYTRTDGKLWRDGTVGDTVYLPCNRPGTVDPMWFCPEEVVVIEVAAKTFVVYFDFDKSAIRADQVGILEEALAYAKEVGSDEIALASFCDFRGTDDYNVGLGSRRAESVKSWFVGNGLDTGFVIDNNGEFDSIVRQTTAVGFCGECWQDRRVEITVE